MKYDLTGNVVIESRLLRAVDAMNIQILKSDDPVLRADLGVKLGVLIDALEAVNAANDAVERVNFVVEGFKHV